MGLMEKLLGARELVTGYSVQPYRVSTARPVYKLGAISAVTPTPAVNPRLLTTAPIGYRVPPAPIVNGSPIKAAKIKKGAGSSNINNAPKGGKC